MLKHLVVLLRFFCFWIILSVLDRLFFILSSWEQFRMHAWTEIGATFVHGFRMDLSMAAYISALPLLGYLINYLYPKLPSQQKFIRAYSLGFVILLAMITVGNFNIYREWGTKINYKALDFALNAPGEALASSMSSPLLLSSLVLLSFLGLAYWLYKKMLVFQLPESKANGLIKILFAVGLLGIHVLIIRGGWQLSPLNQSMAYFSEKPILNMTAVNTPWNLFRDISNNLGGQQNPYQYFDPKRAAAITQSCYPELEPATEQVLEKPKPNVVIILWESFTAQVVESLGGEEGLAPELEKIIQKGILFENIYASGDRTDKGTIAVLSAFPSQAIRSIVKEEPKQAKLPALTQTFRQNGYHTSFYYGGESEFYGNKSYMLSHGNQVLVDKNSFLGKDMNSKWGAFDGVVYQKQLQDFRSVKEPFFSVILTLTNHEPFELPVAGKYPGTDPANLFRSTAHYADSCLGAYLREAAKQDWYKNTLFVIVADHGHRLPSGKYENYRPERFRIPLVFFGEAIKPTFRGKRIAKLGGQTDVARTLLNQLQMDASAYKWSKDLLNPGSREFAFYDYDNGFGWISPEQSVVFDNVGKQVVYRKNKSGKVTEERSIELGKAYLQTVYQEFLNY